MLVKIDGKRGEEKLVVSSRDVAKHFDKRHDNVLRDIETQYKHLLHFGEMFCETVYKDSYGREQKQYLMNRDGFSLLVMGFTGEKALEWKIKYIQAFNEMEKELKRIADERKQWEIERAKGIVIRHILTDAIKNGIAESPNKKFAYPNYTKMIYKTIFGKTMGELREMLGITDKDSIRDNFNAEQLAEVDNLERLVSGLINLGWGYPQIKEFLDREFVPKLQTA